jgi:hypothetical protein
LSVCMFFTQRERERERESDRHPALVSLPVSQSISPRRGNSWRQDTLEVFFTTKCTTNKGKRKGQ